MQPTLMDCCRYERQNVSELKMPPCVDPHRWFVCASQGGVVLAEAQPLTDGQIQQTLRRELSGRSCSASDADAEHCSPMSLLHNIERQVGGTSWRAHPQCKGCKRRESF